MGGTNNQTPKQQLDKLVKDAKQWNKTDILKKMKKAAWKLKDIFQPTGIEDAFLKQLKKQLERSYASKINAGNAETVYKYLVEYCDEVLRVLKNNPTLKLPEGMDKRYIKEKIEELKNEMNTRFLESMKLELLPVPGSIGVEKQGREGPLKPIPKLLPVPGSHGVKEGNKNCRWDR